MDTRIIQDNKIFLQILREVPRQGNQFIFVINQDNRLAAPENSELSNCQSDLASLILGLSEPRIISFVREGIKTLRARAYTDDDIAGILGINKRSIQFPQHMFKGSFAEGFLLAKEEEK